MRPAGGRDRERGAMILIMAGVLVLVAVLAMGALTIMRLVLARQEVQRTADAACLAATTIIKHDGLPFDGGKQGAAAAIAARNHAGLDFRFAWDSQEADDHVDVQCQVSLDFAAPAMIWSGGRMTVTASAQGTVPQETYTQATKKYPKFVLVLDYSGSMTRPLVAHPDGPSSYDLLKTAVNTLLDYHFDIKYGLIIFASSVIDSVDIGLGNGEEIRKHVNASHGCPNGNDCNTDTWDALKAARALFDKTDGDEARYVLLVSDGQPNIDGKVTPQQGIPLAEKAAGDLFADGVSIYTLQLVNTTVNQADLIAFMKSISGDPPDGESPAPDPDYYASADSEQKLDDEFQSIGHSLACAIGPLSPAPPDPTKLHVFVKDPGAGELVVLDAKKADPPAAKIRDLWRTDLDFHNGDYFFYKADKQTIYVTPPVCDAMVTDGQKIVVRYDRVRLSQ